MPKYLPIGELCIELTTESDVIDTEWARLFGGLLQKSPSFPVVMQLDLDFVAQLPERPAMPPIFVDKRVINSYTGNGLHNAYRLENGDLALYFPDGGYVTITINNDTGSTPTATAKGVVTRKLIKYEFFEDLVTIAISPIMRLHHYYFVHSSGVSYNDQGVLFVGQSKSGKTTTCLNLVLNGWEMLSNDVIILHPTKDGIYAYPMPDLLTIRPKTLDLLPQLKPLIARSETTQHLGSVAMAACWELFKDHLSAPVKVRAICFPQVDDRLDSELIPQLDAITLARLLETSLDCWDTATLDQHASLMADLTAQIDAYALSLGRDTHALPDLLIQQLALE